MSRNDQQKAIGEAIVAAAETCLRSSSLLAEHPIRCEFRQGTLTLRGHVPSYSLKQAAQSLVERLEGVTAVDNQLDVIPPPASYGASGGQGPVSRKERPPR
jgi:osmotically-inducible protein OsmY